MTVARVIAAGLIAGVFATSAAAKLPPPTDTAKAQAVETAAKAAWSDKLAAYELCLRQDRIAEAYRGNLRAAGKNATASMPTAPCSNPGPYVSPLTPAASKPLEASGAHSPAGTATSPPSTNASQAEVAGTAKK